MNAILTKFIGPTNSKGNRYKAWAPSLKVSKIISARDNMSTEENHRRAATLLAQQQGWYGEMVGGSTDAGYAFVFVHHKRESGGNWEEPTYTVPSAFTEKAGA